MSLRRFLKKSHAATATQPVPVTDETPATEASTAMPVLPSLMGWTEFEGELALDVYITPTTVIVRSPVAGVKPKDLSISLHNDLLTIRGRRQDEEGVASASYVVQECHWGSFSRSVLLPVAVEHDGAEAVLKGGVLKVTLQRAVPTSVSVKLVEE